MIKSYSGWLNENHPIMAVQDMMKDLQLYPFTEALHFAPEDELKGFDAIRKILQSKDEEIWSFSPEEDDGNFEDNNLLMTNLFNLEEGPLFSDLKKIWEAPVNRSGMGPFKDKSASYIRYSGEDSSLVYCVWDGLMWDSPVIYTSEKSLREYFSKLGQYENLRKMDVIYIKFLHKYGFVKEEDFERLRGKVRTNRFGV